MATSAAVIPILTNEIVKVPFATRTGKPEEVTININLEKGVTVQYADLKLSGDQGYLSGADLTISVNGTEQLPGLHWVGEAGKKTIHYNIATKLYDGLNRFNVIYNTAYGVLSDQQCVVNAEIVLTLIKPTTGSPGYTVGKVVKSGFWDKFGQTVRESANYLIAFGVIGAIAISGVAYLAHDAERYNPKS